MGYHSNTAFRTLLPKQHCHIDDDQSFVPFNKGQKKLRPLPI